MADDRKTSINLQNEVDAFLTFSISKQVQHYCQLKSRQDLLDIDFDFKVLDVAVDHSNYPEFQDVPLILCYGAAARLFRQPSILNYNTLKEHLNRNANLFPPVSLRNLYTNLENSAIQLFTDRKKMYEELFSLYQLQADSGLFIVDNVLLPQILKNIITVALRLGETSWAKRFLEKHQPNIESTDVYQWNLARIYFQNKEFNKTLNLLNDARIKDSFYILETKRLLLKTYYELGYDELFHSFLNAFRVFLSRKELKSKWKQMNLDFIKYAFHLAALGKYDNEKREKLEKEVLADQSVMDKDWLLEQIRKPMKS